MPLYGQEINLEINPLEADLGFGVGLKRVNTIGVPALAKLAEQGLARQAASLSAKGGRVARTTCKVFQGEDEVGFVTSGSYSPTLERNIARVLVKAGSAEVGGSLDVEIRGKRHPYEVVPSPFYSRKR